VKTPAGELQLAIGKLASAQQAAASKDNARAALLAEEAQVDAQVAELQPSRRDRARQRRSRKTPRACCAKRSTARHQS
jgi:hypothetical protein